MTTYQSLSINEKINLKSYLPNSIERHMKFHCLLVNRKEIRMRSIMSAPLGNRLFLTTKKQAFKAKF